MKKYQKLLALLLSMAMVFALASCGGGTSGGDTASPTPDSSPAESPEAVESPAAEAVSADDIPDNMTASDGVYQIAFVTDVGSLKDKSFNQGTYDGVKLYANANGLSYKYYQPAGGNEATDDDRYNSMKSAVEGGADVVVCAGFLQEAALRKAAIDFPDTPFVFIDGYPLTEDPNVEGSPVLSNVAGISFKEEQCGYFAGYAAVMDGFTKLGFCGGGGGTNDACCRYGYGFVQGAEAAAAVKGVDVEINYSWQYGANFSASPELQTMASGWYNNGTEIIFACGGSMFQSISAAASASDGYVIGVDVDQSGESDTVVTSAMKGLSDAVQWAVGHVYDGTWDEIGGTGTSLGVQEGAVGLPTAESSWRFETFTVEEYETMFQEVLDGTLVVDNDFTKLETTDWAHVTLNII